MINVTCICGARPNFMKVAPLMEAFAATDGVAARLVHTGQHYDEKMSDLFFRDLGMPEPDVNLEVGSGSHAEQTAEIMRRFEPLVMEQRPDWVVVVGDVNSTLACALVAVKLGIGVAHIEAGLRSFDRTMPEEINRLLTDAISDLLFVSEPSGMHNLRKEGYTDERLHFVGNVMIDTLLKHRARAAESDALRRFGLSSRQYAVVTLHRPSNVDAAETLGDVLAALGEFSTDMPIVFPMHPRSRRNVEQFGLTLALKNHPNLHTPEPIGYLDFLKLLSDAAVVLTDSGGIQEETTILGVPCLTLRPNTERPVTITHGTNQLVQPKRSAIIEAARRAVSEPRRRLAPPEKWDGRAAERIAHIIACANRP